MMALTLAASSLTVTKLVRRLLAHAGESADGRSARSAVDAAPSHGTDSG
jgi:hypothetical protein